MMRMGAYWIGDLCYVMDNKEWDQVCELIIKKDEVLDGEFILPDGRVFAIYSTMWGDGLYRDQKGNRYPVDSGSIGCIKFDDIQPSKREYSSSNGHIQTFIYKFHTSGGRGDPDWNGVIRFGDVMVNTNSDDDEY